MLTALRFLGHSEMRRLEVSFDTRDKVTDYILKRFHLTSPFLSTYVAIIFLQLGFVLGGVFVGGGG